MREEAFPLTVDPGNLGSEQLTGLHNHSSPPCAENVRFCCCGRSVGVARRGPSAAGTRLK